MLRHIPACVNLCRQSVGVGVPCATALQWKAARGRQRAAPARRKQGVRRRDSAMVQVCARERAAEQRVGGAQAAGE